MAVGGLPEHTSTVGILRREFERMMGNLRTRRSPMKVSVVINTLNRCSHLEQALIALADQTYRPFEVVVVNGPSVDGTAGMLERFADRARLLDCPEANLGLSRNIGVQQAAGEIVAFIDDDAIPEPDWLEHVVGEFADLDVAAVGGPVFDLPLNRIEWKVCVATRLGEADTNAPMPFSSYNRPGADPFPYFAGCNMSFRRSALRAIGGFNPMLKFGYDDVDVCRLLNDGGSTLRYAPAAVVRHARAPSATRDADHHVTDPYWWVYSRTVFALQAGLRSEREQVATFVDDWVAEWRTYADNLLSEGIISAEMHERFLERASSGAVDGKADGLTQRPFQRVGRRPRGDFRPYI